ncbi:MAG: hypothetical protein P4L40_24340 [Terracidiphilus sp.]|nr:hypothetical protein [Terracidiphilus sp.]
MYKKITHAEYEELLRQANRERAAKAAATRRVRRWLDGLYALEDVRDQVEMPCSPDDSVGFLERMFRLEDPRE